LLVTVRPLLLIPLGFGFRFCRNRTGTGHVLAAEKHDVKKSNCVVLQQSDECGTRQMERVRVEWGYETRSQGKQSTLPLDMFEN
jgi:hypothetical protein